MWFTLFVVSLVINVFGIMYVRWLLKTLSSIGEDLDALKMAMSEYVGHVKSVYELEMFYGDQTLKSLMDHGRDLIGKIEDVDFVLNLEEEIEVDGEKETEEE